MPDKRSRSKLSAEQQNFVCSLIAQGLTSRRIAEEIEETFGIEISHVDIYLNYIKGKKWQPLIKKFVNQLTKEIMKHPLAQKKTRLNILQRAVNEAETWRTTKYHVDKEGKVVAKVQEKKIGTIASLVKEARTEVEGEAPSGAGAIIIVTNGDKDAENPTFPKIKKEEKGEG